MDRSFLESIRFKIILLYMLMLVITLFLFSLLIYYNFSNTLYRKMDYLLTLKAEGIEKAIRTYWQTEKLEMTSDWAVSHLFFRKEDANFKKIASDLTVGADVSDMVIYIFDAKGNLVAASMEVPGMLPPTRRTVELALGNQSRLDDFSLRSEKNRRLPYRVLSRPVTEKGQVRYVVSVIGSLLPLQEELNQLKRMVFLRVPWVVLVASLAGLFLVRSTLRPVSDMVNTIRKIKAENMGLRLEVPATNDEVERLAETFNEMLTRLDKSFTTQRQFVQDISHELRTPLTVLKGQLEVALKKNRAVEDYKAVLYSCLEEIEKIRHIVNNLLDLARLDSQGLRMEMERVALPQLVRSVLEELKILAQAKNIRIDFDSRQQVFVYGNPLHLQRLFMNLIENAIKYTPAGGRVTLRIDEAEKTVKVDISDTGIGIPEKDLPHIFDRFYRVDKARQSGEGFGLGLSIAKSIVSAHRGDIQVRSRWGQGTTFTLQLPQTV